MNDSPIIVALDLESAEQARSLVHALGDEAGFYKVGMELYAAAGLDFVRELLGSGKRVFLDLKMYDIGETVRRAVAQVARVGVQFLTVHASSPVVRAAVDGRGSANLRILAVTVLTSLDANDIREQGYELSLQELVTLRVRNAMAAGADGLITSPLEVARVRELAGPDAILVTPGVRSAGAAVGDQKRVATPAEAIRNGANYLVVGRQVTRAGNPAEAYRSLQAELGL